MGYSCAIRHSIGHTSDVVRTLWKVAPSTTVCRDTGEILGSKPRISQLSPNHGTEQRQRPMEQTPRRGVFRLPQALSGHEA